MSRAMGALAASFVGRRVEIAPHLEPWMRGDRYGTIMRVTGRGFRVKLTRSGRTLTLTDETIQEYLD